MNFPWAISIACEDAGAIATLRLVSGIEVADAGGLVWLRGKAADDRLAPALAALPACGRYE